MFLVTSCTILIEPSNMKLLLLLVALVSIEAEAGSGGCHVSDWGPWSDWTVPQHDSNGQSHLVEEKTGLGSMRREVMMEIKEMLREDYYECIEQGDCLRYDERPSEGRVDCIDNMANDLECHLVDQLSFVSIEDFHFDPTVHPLPLGNDIWGWTDPLTADEYAIMGLTTGTTFIRVTDPENPVVIGHMVSHGRRSVLWHDMKVIGNFAYIVSEELDHGIQVFDLTHLRDAVPPVTFLPDSHYDEVGNCHNIIANEETNYLYCVGAMFGNYTNCRAGLHIVDASDPLALTFAGCYEEDRYVHDAQCVIYHGPDVQFQGHEICFCYNEDTLTIVDVDDKANMKMLSRTNYTGSMYTHQGWLTEDHAVLLLDDELDEQWTDNPYTRTYLWDVNSLQAPVLRNTYQAQVESIDHNQYVVGDLTFQANYHSGLRILSINQADYELTEVAYFDVYPGNNSANFNGAWSVYPYFNSGNLIVSCTELGLFTVKPDYAAIEQIVSDSRRVAERMRYREVLEATDSSYCPQLQDKQTKELP